MASIEYDQVPQNAAHPAIGPVQPEVSDLVGIARRGWLFIVGGLLFGLVCAMLLLSAMPPVYKATSRIAFEKTLARYMQSNKVSNEPIIDDYDTLGQTYVISSEAILLQAIRSLGLANDPDFVGENNTEGVGSRIRSLFRDAALALGFAKEPAAGLRSDPEKIALDTVVRDLTVIREDVPSVISIAFSLKDPVKAATIVNAIVDTYMEANIASKISSTKVAGKFMQDRVEELKQQAQDAERALFDFKAANKLVGTDQASLSQGQSVGLGHSLTAARLALADARSRMERLAKDPAAAALYTQDNELISRQRSELMDLSIRAKEIEKRVGPDHLAAVKIRTRMQEVREAIAEEQKRIAEAVKKDYELARVRYEELSKTHSEALSEDSENGRIQTQFRGLERTAEVLRTQYDRAVQQVSELNKVDAQPSITPDARVLMRAAPPTQTEASKKRLLILAGGSVVGLLLGCGIVFGRTLPFGVFRTSQQVTHASGLPCAVLPEIVDPKEQVSLMTGEYALDWPYSRFAQTLHAIWATIHTAQAKSSAKVVCIASSVPGEGKTTVAINLAAHCGLHTNSRVLVIDGDLHRQSLTTRVAPEAIVGFKEALKEPSALAKFVVKKERLNLDVLACPAAERATDAAELLATVEMEQLIEVARQSYDLVIIEAPPLAAVIDYKMIARHCDGFIFVVQWGQTSQRLVRECLSDASSMLDRILCVVLNKADPCALQSIERYKGDGFQNYYTEPTRV
jgi:polysaccharide biosynthesis transport protein